VISQRDDVYEPTDREAKTFPMKPPERTCHLSNQFCSTPDMCC